MSDDGRSIERSGSQGGIVAALQAEIDRLNGALAAERRRHTATKRDRDEAIEQAEASRAEAIRAEEHARGSTVTRTPDGWTRIDYNDGSGGVRWRDDGTTERFDSEGWVTTRLVPGGGAS